MLEFNTEKTMKILSNFILSLVGLSLLSGCDSMFRDEPYNKVTENVVWSNPLLLDEYVNAWYDGMSDGFNTFVFSTIGMMKSSSRYNMVWFGDQTTVSKSDWYNAGFGDLLKSNDTELTNWASVKWSAAYLQIQSINTLLENLNNISDGEQKQRIEGEAHFLRAYYYYNLWRMFGGPILIDHTYNPLVKVEKFPRASYERMVEFIASESDKAANLLPTSYAANDAGRATRGAALMLKAKAYLWASSKVFQNKEEEWLGFKDDHSAEMLSKARAAYEELFALKAYKLMPVEGTTQEAIAQNYRKIFLTKNSEESILEYQHADDGNYATKNGHRLDRDAASPFFTGTTAAYTPTHNHVMEYGMQEGYTYDAKDPYSHRDYRFYANVLYDGAKFRGHEMDIHSTTYKDSRNRDSIVAGVDLTPYGTSTSAAYTLTGYYTAKFMNEATAIDNNETYASSQNYIIWRLAEAKLDYAEVLFNLGETDKALTEVNDVRERVHMYPLTSLTWEELMNERRVEMAFEETTYWDLLRWGIAVERLNGESNPLKKISISVKNGTTTYTVGNVHRFPKRVRLFRSKQYYMPIPWSEIRFQGVSQNPEWDEM